MNPILVGVALAITLGTVAAISARRRSAALLGLAVALAAAPFLAQPLPGLSTLATRVVGAMLVAYLLRSAGSRPVPDVATPDAGPGGGSRLGWPAELLLSAGAWIIGLNVSIQLATLQPTGPVAPDTDLLATLTPAALAASAGLASIVGGVVPTFFGRSAFRSTIGAIILIQGGILFRTGVGGAPGDLEQLAGVAMLVATAITGSVLISAEARLGVDASAGARSGSSDAPVSDAGAVRRRPGRP